MWRSDAVEAAAGQAVSVGREWAGDWVLQVQVSVSGAFSTHQREELVAYCWRMIDSLDSIGNGSMILSIIVVVMILTRVHVPPFAER